MNQLLVYQKIIENASILQLLQTPPTYQLTPTVPVLPLGHYQTMLLKAQAGFSHQFKNPYELQVQKPMRICPQLILKTANLDTGLIPNQMAPQPSFNQFQQAILTQERVSKEPETAVTQESQNPNLKGEIEKMLKIILENTGQSSQGVIENQRKIYSSHPQLAQVYDKLVMKFYSAKKCKEDIVRYIIRKAFKVMKTALIKKEKVAGKKATLLFIRKYFHSRFEEMQKEGVDLENDDEVLEFIMPYKKKSLNRTMNSNFVLSIFSSEEFCEEYRKFLEKFDQYLLSDNQQKIDKSIHFILECVKNNNVSKLVGFNRLPWLKTWLDDTRNIAFSLLPENQQDQDPSRKKLKK